MTAPADGVLAVDGGRQDPNEFTEWHRTEEIMHLRAYAVASALVAMWQSIAGRVDEDRREDLQERLDAFDEARRLHKAAADRIYAARGVL